MNKYTQRVAIAEACGIDTSLCYTCGVSLSQWITTCPTLIPEAVEVYLPDYLNDLNAMHKVEDILTINQQHQYLDWLNELTLGYDRAFSTAAQRAEAFLRTLNLWTEDGE